MPEVPLHFALPSAGLVMWLLVAVSLIGFVIVGERLLFLHRGQIRASDFLDGIKNLVRRGRTVEALTVCEETPGPVARIVKTALLHAADDEIRLRLAVQGTAVLELPTLERRLGSVATIARLGPLLGLFGTVLAALDGLGTLGGGTALAAYPTTGEFLRASADALHATAFGLALAILAQIAYQLLQGRVRAIVHDMEVAAHDIIQFLVVEAPQADGPVGVGRTGSLKDNA